MTRFVLAFCLVRTQWSGEVYLGVHYADAWAPECTGWVWEARWGQREAVFILVQMAGQWTNADWHWYCWTKSSVCGKLITWRCFSLFGCVRYVQKAIWPRMMSIMFQAFEYFTCTMVILVLSGWVRYPSVLFTICLVRMKSCAFLIKTYYREYTV